MTNNKDRSIDSIYVSDALVSVADYGDETQRINKLRDMHISDIMSRARRIINPNNSDIAFSTMSSDVIEKNISNLKLFQSPILGLTASSGGGYDQIDICTSSIGSAFVGLISAYGTENRPTNLPRYMIGNALLRLYKTRGSRYINGPDSAWHIMEYVKQAVKRASQSGLVYVLHYKWMSGLTGLNTGLIYDYNFDISGRSGILDFSYMLSEMVDNMPDFEMGRPTDPGYPSGIEAWVAPLYNHIYDYFNKSSFGWVPQAKKFANDNNIDYMMIVARAIVIACIMDFPLGDSGLNFIVESTRYSKSKFSKYENNKRMEILFSEDKTKISTEAFQDVVSKVPLSWIRTQDDILYCFYYGLCLMNWRSKNFKFFFNSNSQQSPDLARVQLVFSNGSSITYKLHEFVKELRNYNVIRRDNPENKTKVDDCYVTVFADSGNSHQTMDKLFKREYFGLTFNPNPLVDMDKVINYSFSDYRSKKKHLIKFKKELKTIVNLFDADKTILDLLLLLNILDYDEDGNSLIDKFSESGFFYLTTPIKELAGDQINIFRDALLTSQLYFNDNASTEVKLDMKNSIIDSVKGIYTRFKMDEYEEIIDHIDEEFSEFSLQYESISSGFSSAEPASGENVITKTTEGENLIIKFFKNIKEFANYVGISIDADSNVSFGDPVLKYKFWVSNFRDKFIIWNEERLKNLADVVDIPKDKYESVIDKLMKATNLNDIKIPLPSFDLVTNIFSGIVKAVAKGFYNTMAVIENVYNIFDSVYNNFVVNKKFIPVKSGNPNDRNYYALMIYPSTMGITPSRQLSEIEQEEYFVDFGLEGDSNYNIGRLIAVNDAVLSNYLDSNLKGKDLFLSLLSGRDKPVSHYYKPGMKENAIATSVVLAQAALAGGAAASSAGGTWITKLIAAGVASASVFAINAAKRLELTLNEFPKHVDSKSVLNERFRSNLDVLNHQRMFIWNAASIYGMPGSNLKLAQRISMDAMAIAGGFVSAAVFGAISGAVVTSIDKFSKKMNIKRDFKRKNSIINLPNGVSGNYNDLTYRQKQAAVQWAMFNRDPRNYGKAIAGLSKNTADALKESLGDLDGKDTQFSKSQFNKLFGNKFDDISLLGRDLKDQLSTLQDNVLSAIKSNDDKTIAILAETTAIAGVVGAIKADNVKISSYLKLIINRLGG